MSKFTDDRHRAAAGLAITKSDTAADLAVLVKAFDDTMPSSLERAEVSLAKPEAQVLLPKMAALGLWTPQQFAIPELFGGFCRDWSKYRAMIVKAKWVIRLVAGAQVAAALMGVLAVVDGVHKQACSIVPPEGE